MHFVAMLAFSLPGMETSYDLTLTLLSLVIALAFTGTGFGVMNWRSRAPARLAPAGLLMGVGHRWHALHRHSRHAHGGQPRL